MTSRWHIHLRRAPKPGDIVWNGMQPARLERCPQCGDGFLARELESLPGGGPQPEAA